MVTDLHAAALAPIDLHRLGRLVVDFLIDAPACGTDRPQVAADGDRAAGIAIGAASDLLVDAHRREVGILGQQGVDLGLVRVQEAGAARGLSVREAAPTRAPRPPCAASSEVVAKWPGRRASRSRPGGGSRPTRRRSWQSSFPGRNVATRWPGARYRPVASALGPARTGGAGRAAARRAPGSSGLMGDQIAGQQFVAGLDQGRQRSSAAGWPACRRRRTTARAGRPRRRGRSTTARPRARDGRHVLAHEAAVHPGPACCGRTPQSRGNQNAFWDHAWAPESETGCPS